MNIKAEPFLWERDPNTMPSNDTAPKRRTAGRENMEEKLLSVAAVIRKQDNDRPTALMAVPRKYPAPSSGTTTQRLHNILVPAVLAKPHQKSNDWVRIPCAIPLSFYVSIPFPPITLRSPSPRTAHSALGSGIAGRPPPSNPDDDLRRASSLALAKSSHCPNKKKTAATSTKVDHPKPPAALE